MYYCIHCGGKITDGGAESCPSCKNVLYKQKTADGSELRQAKEPKMRIISGSENIRRKIPLIPPKQA